MQDHQNVLDATVMKTRTQGSINNSESVTDDDPESTHPIYIYHLQSNTNSSWLICLRPKLSHIVYEDFSPPTLQLIFTTRHVCSPSIPINIISDDYSYVLLDELTMLYMNI